LEEYTKNNEMRNGDHELALREKETELEAMQAAMDEALLELEELKLVRFGEKTGFLFKYPLTLIAEPR
jgi:hypothetical protein